LVRQLYCGAKISGLIVLLLVVVSVFGATDSDTAIKHYDREIRQKSSIMDSIKVELEKGREKLLVLQKEEGNHLERINQVEKNIKASHTYLNLLANKIDTVEIIIKGLLDSLKSAEKNLTDRQYVMKGRIRQIYMTGTPHPFLIILASQNPVDLLHRVRYMEELNRYDRKIANDISLARVKIDNTKAARQVEREQLGKLVDEKKAEQGSLEKEETLHKSMLDGVRSQKSAFQQMIADLEATQKELNTLLALLEKKRKAAKQ
jgi:peptidoglycan hydrolase CwlO-like protein